MTAAELEKEIKAAKAMVEKMNQCLVIFESEKMNEAFNATMSDIQKINIEIEKLIAAKLVVMEAEKGAAAQWVDSVKRKGYSMKK
jgi:DeoR/GlpR family transcriptional regulator of sugar metabolism